MSDIRLLAKYPFLKEAGELIKQFGIGIEDLAKPEHRPIVERALSRVIEAITKLSVTVGPSPEVEVLSFPVSIILVAATGNQAVAKRYALAEAQATYANLRGEDDRTLERVAKELLGEANVCVAPEGCRLRYPAFLRNAVTMKHEKWKLVNRTVSDGWVLVTREELYRLLSEEVRRRVELRIGEAGKVGVSFDNEVAAIARAAEALQPKEFQLPKGVKVEAFPPCILHLYNAAVSGQHLSHAERFTLTSFLVKANMPIDQIVSVFSRFPDFNEALTRYQVEHIAGKTGAKVAYKPPSCRKLKTLGICRNPDELCRSVYSPLSYYERKLRGR